MFCPFTIEKYILCNRSKIFQPLFMIKETVAVKDEV